MSGQPATYLNFGRGGTTSANSLDNGLWPARLQPVLDSGADVLLLHFGMNELGQATTSANIKSIASQAKAVGMDVIVMSVSRRNAVDCGALAGWNYTDRALWRAAVEAGAAYAAQHWNVMDEQLGGHGRQPGFAGGGRVVQPPRPGGVRTVRPGTVAVDSGVIALVPTSRFRRRPVLDVLPGAFQPASGQCPKPQSI
ncbi:SGNH/GDSL hydrolase family protein [Stenotrophomonas maltophilia]|uniref:SGNH/GDSL hydrolase family protein n=1 Tax=Stenotrophomonas maltophilia TaxID=40324 RepID=UPI002402718E|nr:SGNH/GDSL hydrolase family protein [Stenotrophomonas maltophilia]